MKIRTVSELSTVLRGDLAWRRKELVTYRGLVCGAEAAKKQALLRGAVAVLYAHWEGFVKAACQGYVAFVRQQRLNLCDLSNNFLALVARSHLHSLNESKKVLLHISFVEWFLGEWVSRARMPREFVVSVFIS